jgi:hypothetical protein
MYPPARETQPVCTARLSLRTGATVYIRCVLQAEAQQTHDEVDPQLCYPEPQVVPSNVSVFMVRLPALRKHSGSRQKCKLRRLPTQCRGSGGKRLLHIIWAMPTVCVYLLRCCGEKHDKIFSDPGTTLGIIRDIPMSRIAARRLTKRAASEEQHT